MKTRFAVLSTLLAAAIACGGGAEKSNPAQKTTVYIETDSALTYINQVASVEITGTGPSGAVGPFALVYDATKGTFKGSFQLAAGTYNLTGTAKNAAGTAIGSTSLTGVVIDGASVANIKFNIASATDPLPVDGFVITGYSIPGYTDVGVAAPVAVYVAYTGALPTFAWTAKRVNDPTANCAGSFSAGNVAAPTFTGTAADACTITVTVTAAGNTNNKATRSGVLGVGVDANVTGSFIPAPVITKVDLLSNGGYDGTWNPTPVSVEGTLVYRPNRPFPEPACSLARSGTGATATQTCSGTFKINSGIAAPLPEVASLPGPTITLSAPQFIIGVTYHLGGLYDAVNPPKVGVDVACPNATSNGVSTYTAAAPIAGSGPGVFPCPVGAVCTGSASLWWTEPIAFNPGFTGDLCTLTVSVNNQGAIDTFPAKVWLTQ